MGGGMRVGKRRKTGAWGDPQLSPNSDSFSGSPLEAVFFQKHIVEFLFFFFK